MALQRHARGFLVLLILAAACHRKTAGTAPEGPVVARVGNRTVTRAYFEDRLAKMDRKYLPDTLDLAGKKEFLQLVINKEVMELKAEELGYAEDPQVQRSLQMMEDIQAANLAIDRATAGGTEVTEDEIREFYARKQQEVMVKHIVLGTRKEAEDVLGQIRAGADFDSMVSRYSRVPRRDENGETLPLTQRAVFGWVKYGSAQPDFEKAVFDTPLNQVSEPVQTTYGWHLLRPTATRDDKQLPIEEMRAKIKEQIQRRKRRMLTGDYYESILKEHHFKLDEDALNLVYGKLPPGGEPTDPAAEVKPVLDFTAAEREQKLFEVDGKDFTIGDFSDQYDNTVWPERPQRNNGSLGLYYWIRDFWQKPLQLQRARQDGIYDSPQMVNDRKSRREEMMVNALHTNLIANQVPDPTDAEVQEFFAQHADVYVDKEKRVCNVIFHPRERVVRRAYEEIQGGADFIQTAIRYNDSATEAKHVQTAAFSRDEEQYLEIAPVAFGQAPGQYSEPFKTKEGWVLLQLQQVIPQRPFVLEDVREFVIKDWQAQWSENRLNELLAEWKQQISIQIDDEVLAGAEVRREDVVVPGRAPAASAGAAESH